MAHVRYPRPDLEPLGTSLAEKVGTLGLFAAVPGLLGALEIMLVGEELSTLGERMLPLTHRGGLLGSETGLYSWAPLIVGGPVLAFSIVRLATAIGLLKRRVWASRFLLWLVLPSMAVDLACFSTFTGIPWIGFDLLAPFALRRRGR